MKLSVVMPVYNEKNTLLEILERVEKVDIEKEIIIIDDFSTDGTREILKKAEVSGLGKDIKIIFQEKNQGKGAAIRKGLEHTGGDYVIIQDGDLEYNPEDYHKLFQSILQEKAEVVYGSRFSGKHKGMFFWHWAGNRLLTFLTNILYKATLSDMETCYKLFKTEVIKSIRLRSNRFEFEPEVTAKILKKGIKIYEVPISYAGREFHEGKKITWRDGIVALLILLRYRFTD
jgi:glycosyltransferase involved in cell wall biosynthesis